MSTAGDAVLTLNAGSSSIKFALFPLAGDVNAIPRQATFSGQIDGIGTLQSRFIARNAEGQTLAAETPELGNETSAGTPHHRALDILLRWIDAHDDGVHLRAIGHRVVHGGEKYAQPVLLNPGIRHELASFIPLAPLHQPHNLDAIAATTDLMPALPQVACFDTAFHRNQPEVAQCFALPRAITAQGVRRYGFHGLSYEYIASVLPEVLGKHRAEGRIVVAHLGNGASMCAMRERRSIATTMGFTALDGLVMGTRCGNLDPGVLLYLMEFQNLDVRQLTRLLYKESGLLGVSGTSSDMRQLLASSTPEAREAIELFCYRIQRELGSLAAALGGLDALVFTGGIGEHAAKIRHQVCQNAAWLGIDLDDEANAHHAERITSAQSRIPALILPTNEEWMIAGHTARLIQ